MCKRIFAVLSLLLCVTLLCSCQSRETEGKRYNVVNSANDLNANNQQQVFNQNTPQFDLDLSQPETPAENVIVTAPPYAPAQDNTANQGLSLAPSPAPTVRGEYAGATPVVIDPIDKPTPTPLPALTFDSAVYDATKVHLSFKAPAGWIINDSANDTYIITNPASNVDYAAFLSIRVYTVSAQMSETEMKTEIKNTLNTLKSGFTTFSPSSTASRTLLDKAGVYANYTATLADGTEVAGRVHMTCIGRTAYMLHVSYPRGYTETYKTALYDTFRHSVKITQ